MEILIMSTIILGICIILGINYNYIMLAVVCLFSCFLLLLFMYSFIRLLFSKRKEAKFVRFDKMGNRKYQAACYLVEGEEYLCIFPKEGFMTNKLYRQDKIYHVMLNKSMKRVYDRFAISTCMLGLIFGMGLSTGIIYCFINM